MPPLLDAAMTGHNWAHLAVSAVLWAGVPVVVGVVRVRRTEIH